MSLSATSRLLRPAYRSELHEGRRCPVGWLIPDRLYTPDIEGKAANTLPIELVMEMLGLKEGRARHAAGFLRQLQFIHDYNSRPEGMQQDMRQFARRNRLKIPTEDTVA